MDLVVGLYGCFLPLFTPHPVSHTEMPQITTHPDKGQQDCTSDRSNGAAMVQDS